MQKNPEIKKITRILVDFHQSLFEDMSIEDSAEVVERWIIKGGKELIISYYGSIIIDRISLKQSASILKTSVSVITGLSEEVIMS